MKDSSPLLTLWPSFSPTINFPASGDIGSFNYHPDTTWQGPSMIQGNPVMEQKIYQEVAGPGSQLGTLTDAVLSLITHLEVKYPEITDNDDVIKLRTLSSKVTAIKEEISNRESEEFHQKLKKLATESPEAFKDLIKDL